MKLGKIEDAKTRADVPTYVLIPAFIISELKTAFQIGFLIFLPFLIIDLVVSSTLDVDGHGDAAARLHLAAVQDPALRPGRRLEPRHPIARGELPLMDPDAVVSLVHAGDGARAASVALPLLLVGLVVGLVVSIFQAVTQIQEQTLAFIPKILAIAGVLVVGGPWMLNQLLVLHDRPLVADPAPSSDDRRVDLICWRSSASSTSPPSSSCSRASRPLFVLAPLFSSKLIPLRVRGIVAVALAIGLSPVVSKGVTLPTGAHGHDLARAQGDARRAAPSPSPSAALFAALQRRGLAHRHARSASPTAASSTR